MKKSELRNIIREEINTYDMWNKIMNKSKTSIKWGTPTATEEFVQYSKQFTPKQRENAFKLVYRTFAGTDDLTKIEKNAIKVWITSGKYLTNLLFAEPLANTLNKLYGKKNEKIRTKRNN